MQREEFGKRKQKEEGAMRQEQSEKGRKSILVSYLKGTNWKEEKEDDKREGKQT